jgi:hypothetical protein
MAAATTIGQAKADERFGEAVVAPSDDNQTQKDQCDDREANSLESQKGTWPTNDQAEQHPEHTPGHHRKITAVDA